MPSVSGSRALVDSASLLWRCRVNGVASDFAAVGPVLETVPAGWLSGPPSSFAGLHCALALAQGEDVVGLECLRRHASAQERPCFRDVVAPLCAALVHVVEGRWGHAADGLLGVIPGLPACGGSDAQREVVEDTLIHALMTDGRHVEAGALLTARLDRRPSPLDRRRLDGLASLAAGSA